MNKMAKANPFFINEIEEELTSKLDERLDLPTERGVLIKFGNRLYSRLRVRIFYQIYNEVCGKDVPA